MRPKTNPPTEKVLGDELREKIAALAGVALVDRSRYYSITKNGTTVAWITPQARAQRVEFPAADGKSVAATKTIAVKDTKQIAPAVAKVAAAAKKVK